MLIFGLAWWVVALVVISLGILTAIVTYDRPIAAFVWTAAAFGGISYLAGGDPLVWFVDHLGLIIGGLVAYLVIGIAYGYFKWYMWLTSPLVKAQIERAFKDYKREQGQHMTVTEDALKVQFMSSSYFPFRASKDAWRISTWIVWWPFSFFWTIAHDLVEYVYRWFVRVLSDSFASIARAVTMKVLK